MPVWPRPPLHMLCRQSTSATLFGARLACIVRSLAASAVCTDCQQAGGHAHNSFGCQSKPNLTSSGLSSWPLHIIRLLAAQTGLFRGLRCQRHASMWALGNQSTCGSFPAAGSACKDCCLAHLLLCSSTCAMLENTLAEAMDSIRALCLSCHASPATFEPDGIDDIMGVLKSLKFYRYTGLQKLRCICSWHRCMSKLLCIPLQGSKLLGRAL